MNFWSDQKPFSEFTSCNSNYSIAWLVVKYIAVKTLAHSFSNSAIISRSIFAWMKLDEIRYLITRRSFSFLINRLRGGLKFDFKFKFSLKLMLNARVSLMSRRVSSIRHDSSK